MIFCEPCTWRSRKWLAVTTDAYRFLLPPAHEKPLPLKDFSPSGDILAKTPGYEKWAPHAWEWAAATGTSTKKVLETAHGTWVPMILVSPYRTIPLRKIAAKLPKPQTNEIPGVSRAWLLAGQYALGDHCQILP